MAYHTKDTKFPDEVNEMRIREYAEYENLLNGRHYTAFLRNSGQEFGERYQQLRYLTCNFAGLISKVIADVLFGEKIKISADKNQDWLESLMYENKMQTQLYESELLNSARGDAVLRVRVKDDEILIEDINPAMYFPEVSHNFRETPKKEELCWIKTVNNGGQEQRYLVSEIYEIGKVITEVYLLKKDNKIDVQIDLNTFNELTGMDLQEEYETKIDSNLLVHVPNYRTGNTFWGTSDYADLKELFFALNNRMTKVDNVLDKHSDPILAIPEGILDENGQVKKESMGLIEKGPDGGVPEYIVWNANLESAFSEIDKIVEMLFMFSETSPDVLGLGKGGQAESGRALKFRMLRTLAKKNRKALYYDQGIKEALVIAQKLAIANGYTVNGEKIASKEVEIPEIIWSDGVVNDPLETAQIESIKLEAGLTSQKRAIMKVEDIEEDDADDIIDEINDEKEKKADFSPFVANTNQDNSNEKDINGLSRDGKAAQ